MKDKETAGSVTNAQLVWRQLEELEDGTLSPDAFDALMEQLKKSPAARQMYLDYFQDSAGLRHIAKVLHERGKMPLVESNLTSRKMLRVSVLSAAALVVILVVIAAFIGLRSPAVPTVASHAAAGSEWTLDAESQGSDPGELIIQPGAKIRVQSGVVKLEKESGCVFLIQGPAEVSFPQLERPVLHHGWLWVDTGQTGAKLEMATPRLRLRNLGTRFGVRVPQEGPTEVHLIEGEVEVRKPSNAKFVKTMFVTDSATVFLANGNEEEAELAVDPFLDLPKLLARPADYRTTILGQSPVGYWTLDQIDRGGLVNETRDSSTAVAAKDVRLGEDGVSPRSGFRGLPAGSRAVHFGGSNENSLLAHLGGLSGAKRREGAVSFWIRRESGEIKKDEILWLAGVASSSKDMPPELAILHTRIDSYGHVVFEIENGESDILLTSLRSVNDGRWHHIAATWSPSSVDLYIDGKLNASDREQRDLDDGLLTGKNVRFGKPSLELYGRYASFRGWADEIALWNRPLSPKEVEWQYRSAMGVEKE